MPHGKPWGIDMVLYLFMKAVSTGAMMLGAILWLLGYAGPLVTIAAPAISTVFIGLTAAVLVIDLERPERFYYILTRPNWRSWMVWGAWFLTGHGLISTVWLIAGWFGWTGALSLLAIPASSSAVLATAYTGFLFAQGLGRDLWQGPHAAIHLIAQSGAAGAASLLIAALPIAGDVPGAGATVARLDARGVAADARAHPAVRERADAERDAASRAGGPDDSRRRVCPALLGCGSRRRRRAAVPRDPGAGGRRTRGHHRPDRAAGACRQRRVGIHLG